MVFLATLAHNELKWSKLNGENQPESSVPNPIPADQLNELAFTGIGIFQQELDPEYSYVTYRF